MALPGNRPRASGGRLVTMTTVGYGDKAPKTAGGESSRLFGMLCSIIFIASFTANITTSLTINEIRGKVHGLNDLYDAKVDQYPNGRFRFLDQQE